MGGTLTYEAPYGRASSATCSINKPDGTAIDTPTVTIDTADTTISLAATAGDLSLQVASATGITAGRAYLIDNSENQREWVRIKQVSSTSLTLYEPLQYTYANADTFVGTRLTAPVSAANSDTVDEGYEWRITATIDSTSYVWIEQYDVVRNVWPERLVEPWELPDYLGDLVTSANRYATDTGGHLGGLVTATERVRTSLLERGLKPSRFRSHVEFKRSVALALALQWAENGWAIPGVYQDNPKEWLDERREQYVKALVTAMNTARSYDANESGNVDASEAASQIGWIRLRR